MQATNSITMQAFGQWWRFTHPVQVITAVQPDEVLAALLAMETAVGQHHLHAAGYLCYEAATAFALDTHPLPPGSPPLLWFGLYRQPEIVTPPDSTTAPTYRLGDWQPALSEAAYHSAIARIKAYIAAGHTYQVNYTFPLRASFAGDDWAFFCRLFHVQQCAYAAYIDLGRYAICSASPELFFARSGADICARPMKGTATRGRTLAEDEANMAWLRQSEKNRAENVMIVDMIRNDLGRVAEIGSVRVPHLFQVERYPTLLQMTSTVTARTQAPFSQVMAQMFPCASITGAPKHRTMQIIRELEPEARSVYTGSIGVLAPDGRSQFNVAIRTVVIDRQQEQATYHVGSGIVWDSQAAEEWAECRLKSEVLTQQRPCFQLLETLRWTPAEGYFLLEAHLRRLADSVTYFGFTVSLHAIRQQLVQLAARQHSAAKVRLLLAADGAVSLEAAPLPPPPNRPLRLALAPAPVHSANIWLYHKTTQRQVYQAARAAHPGYDDVLLWNERGELTESSIANVVLDLDGMLVTPPVEAGLLPGTYRAWLLANGRIRERPIFLAELHRARQVWLINSVRGWQQVEVEMGE